MDGRRLERFKGRLAAGDVNGIGVSGVCEPPGGFLTSIFRCNQLCWNVVQEIEAACVPGLSVTQQGTSGQGTSSLILHIRELIGRDWKVNFQHVSREGYKVANGMARAAQLDGFGVGLFTQPPGDVLPLFQKDRDGLVLP
ncbi:hypothetical protein V6N11_079959 [Hibiscus sabdariffa]|uniref:RNase H type-1 domain-containing protein n=1 Tax=Hibiscus sabdariffa TaxID=183260 RepID=A0ABR2RXC6_9ROSI